MALPDAFSKATEPGGVGRTVRCLVSKNGRQFEVHATCEQYDEKTDALTFPSWLYENGGFTLLGMEGEPDFESLSRN